MRIWIARIFARLHRWDYRNPHDRTCRRCGLNQNRCGYHYHDTGWWEDMNYGRPAPCNSPAQAQPRKDSK